MSKKSTRYSDEFKQQVIDLYSTGNNKVTSLNGEYGVSTVTIYKWIKELSPVKISNTEEISAKDYAKMQKLISELEEEVNHKKYYNLTAAKRAILEYIESWYNRKRIHGSINYMTPSEFHKIA